MYSSSNKKKMTIIHNQHEQSQQRNEYVPSLPLDALYCDEEQWEVEEVEEVVSEGNSFCVKNTSGGNSPSLFPQLLMQQGLFWEDEELVSLFSKEQRQQQEVGLSMQNVGLDSALTAARSEALKWMLKVIAHYGFTALTATLAIGYFDRFVLCLHFQRDKPWMIQLLAVTCLSLAAKVEETQVPLLLDLQVEDPKYVFEARTIQRMELLVLSTLKWEMHPVTPLSFLDHIIRRLGLKTNVQWEFVGRFEHLLVSVLSDSRLVGYLPSVLATATMMHVVEQIEGNAGVEYKNQLLGVLNICKEKVNDCYNLILELSKTNHYSHCNKSHKRKYNEIPDSPSGVIDAGFTSDSSNDSCIVESSLYNISPQPPLFKKGRVHEQQMKLSEAIV